MHLLFSFFFSVAYFLHLCLFRREEYELKVNIGFEMKREAYVVEEDDEEEDYDESGFERITSGVV